MKLGGRDPSVRDLSPFPFCPFLFPFLSFLLFNYIITTSTKTEPQAGDPHLTTSILASFLIKFIFATRLSSLHALVSLPFLSRCTFESRLSKIK